MEEDNRYCPSGKFIRFQDHYSINYHMTDGRFVVCTLRGQNLMVGTTTLNDKQGEINLVDDDWFGVPTGFDGPILSSNVDRGILIATLLKENQSKILVVDLDTRHYNEYRGFTTQSYPVGIEGNTVYIQYYRGYSPVIEGLDLSTMMTTFQYDAPSEHACENLTRIYNGRLVAASTVRSTIGNQLVSAIRGVPSGEILVVLSGLSNRLVIKENGVFFTLDDRRHYYAAFDGRSVILHLEPNDSFSNLVPVHLSYIYAASDAGDSIWVKYTAPGDLVHFINYIPC